MRIRKILVNSETQQKILRKHRISRGELEYALTEGKPAYFKLKDNIFMAIAHYNRYITIIFEYTAPDAVIKTAYTSSDWQVKRYNRQRFTN